ncbi:MAG: DUF3488 domain-containing protein, partial [Eikenella corrodens]
MPKQTKFLQIKQPSRHPTPTTMLVFNPEYIDRPPERLPRLGVLLLLLWITLPLAFALPVGVIIVFGVLWLIQLGLTLIGSRGLPAWATAIGGLAVFGFVFSQLGTFLGSEGGSALLLLLVLLKTYESRVLRDWHMLLTAMVFLMGATVLLNQGMFIGLWLLAGLFGTATCIALFNMPLRLAARHAATALLLTLPLAAVLFIAVPRMSEPLWRIPQPPKPGQAQTGLSDTMQPGSISNLVQSNELAFNATFDGGYTPNQSDLYWRAITMSQFDGEQWSADDDELPTRADTAYTQTIVSYSIIMRDEQGRIPVLDYPIINFNTDNARSKMRFAEGHTIRVRSHDGLRRFVLRAAIGNRLPEKLSPSRQRQLSRLPGYSNQRIRSLARQLRSQSANTVDFVNRTLAYYRNQSFRAPDDPSVFR